MSGDYDFSDYKPGDYAELREGIAPPSRQDSAPGKSGVLNPPTAHEFLARLDEAARQTRFRAKLVVEDEHGRTIMYEYVPGYLSWGQTVEIKATLEGRTA